MKPTLLFGGLTEAHQRLIAATLKAHGYDAIPLPTPDNEALRMGKEYCNKGQCNPVYYTVGNLLKFLLSLRERGERDIEKRYIFVTIGSCGPCRFGMYEMEYRRALKEVGFKNFKVVALDQSRALTEELKELGLELKRTLIVNLLKAVILGDLINDIYYKVKPYEVEANSADRWKEGSLLLLENALEREADVEKTLEEIKRNLSSVEVNYLIPKPRVRIIGEFFAQTTEGEGSYKLAKWLIEEGAEPVVEPVAGWIDYLIYQKAVETKIDSSLSPFRKATLLLKLKLLTFFVRRLYNRYRKILGNKPSEFKKTEKLARLASPYYQTRLVGGGGVSGGCQAHLQR
jgi:predicted nucleotide-binding protein (sugar kinase/HSP70/actin superfamily)